MILSRILFVSVVFIINCVRCYSVVTVVCATEMHWNLLQLNFNIHLNYNHYDQFGAKQDHHYNIIVIKRCQTGHT